MRDIVRAGGAGRERYRLRRCWTAAIKRGLAAKGGARYRLRGGWTAAIKGGVRDIVCPPACNQGVLECCNQRGGCAMSAPGGGAGLRKGGALLDPCSQTDVAQGGWTASKREVRNIVCAIKGGCAISSARGGVLDCSNSTVGCARSSAQGGCAGGVLGPCNQRGGACAISFARWGAGPLQLKGVHAISFARGALDHCNQRRCARYRLHGGCSTAAIKSGVRDVVCRPHCIQRGYRLRGGGGGLLDHCNQRGCARYRMRGGGGAGRLQSKGVCAISFTQGVLDHCNQRGCARYRLHGGFARRWTRGAVRYHLCGSIHAGGGWYQGGAARDCVATVYGCVISSARVAGPLQ